MEQTPGSFVAGPDEHILFTGPTTGKVEYELDGEVHTVDVTASVIALPTQEAAQAVADAIASQVTASETTNGAS